MKKIKFWIRRYFSFSQRPTNGFLFLLLIVVLAILAPFVFFRSNEVYNPAKDQAALDSLVAQLEIQPERSKSPNSRANTYPAPENIKLRPFNPNTLTPAEWLTLGVNRFTASNIIKYRDKAGGFRYKEQLQRIYGMSPELYQTLAPYIQLPARTENNQPEQKITSPSPIKNTGLRITPTILAQEAERKLLTVCLLSISIPLIRRS